MVPKALPLSEVVSAVLQDHANLELLRKTSTLDPVVPDATYPNDLLVTWVHKFPVPPPFGCCFSS